MHIWILSNKFKKKAQLSLNNLRADESNNPIWLLDEMKSEILKRHIGDAKRETGRRKPEKTRPIK